MTLKIFIISCFILGFGLKTFSQEKTFDLTINVSVSKEIQTSWKSKGRLFVFLNKDPNVEPRFHTGAGPNNFFFAKNVVDFKIGDKLVLKADENWSKTSDWSFDNVAEGTYYLQLLWYQETEELWINSSGNIFSEKQKIEVNQSLEVNVLLESINDHEDKIVESKMVKKIDFQSDTLSKWWKKPIQLKAVVLLPYNYEENPNKDYPIRYHIGHYFSGKLFKNDNFMNWWTSSEAPQIITVFLDGQGPFGHTHHVDSENNGPYGYSLINELIPYIEKKYRGTNLSQTRFVDGCSTGGWASLALQLFYPETFNGVFSYSPDAVEFENYQLINIYKDKNAYINEYGYLRPVARNLDGEPVLSFKKKVQAENVVGLSNTYVNSGGQFGAINALYSPKGADGLPKPLFDPFNGKIDTVVVESWKKYDLKKYLMDNWDELGPKLQGKIYIWMGDMDRFYLNAATRTLSEFLQSTNNPTSDAEIVFSAMEGHCWRFSHRDVLEQIEQRVKELKSIKMNGNKK